MNPCDPSTFSFMSVWFYCHTHYLTSFYELHASLSKMQEGTSAAPRVSSHTRSKLLCVLVTIEPSALRYVFFVPSQQKSRSVDRLFCWWARRDSNPQGLFSQRILSPSRIPVPPLAR